MPKKSFGRTSPAAEAAPRLRSRADAASAWWRAEGGTSGWCSLRAATAVGVRHRLDGTGADDFYAWSYDDHRLVVAVADGLGSLAGSAGAAARACVAAADKADTAVAGLQAGNAAAEGGGATTLVVAVVGSDGRCALARVGDSTAFYVEGSGEWRELFEAPDPERADSSTAALPGPDPVAETAELEIAAGGVLVLATDGLADPWRDGPTTVGPSVAAGLLKEPSPLDLARLVDFSRRGCHDDRTAVCVWLDAARRDRGPDRGYFP